MVAGPGSPIFPSLGIFATRIRGTYGAPAWTNLVDSPLKAFRRNPDGSWFCIAPVTLQHPTGRIEVAARSTFIEARNFMGVDLTEWLDAIDRQKQASES